jgi:hypothetical protein
MLAAEAAGHPEISNYAQDCLGVHRKFIWMLDSILEP